MPLPAWLVAAAVAFSVVNLSPLAPAAEASLASIGYSVLRWFDRADIVHHDLWVEVDPERMEARFADVVTLERAGSGDLYVLFGLDAALERVADASGREVAFSRAQTLFSLPFALYRIEAPASALGERIQLRFEWRIAPETVRQINPFVALRFFYAGYDALWYPNMPGEEFFEADLRVTVPQGYTSIADGELLSVEAVDEGRRQRYHFRTPVPVMALGLAVGQFDTLEPRAVEVDDAGKRIEIQAWRPRGWISSVERAQEFAAQAMAFYFRRLGPLPVERFFVAQVPFGFGASYASLFGHVYGGDLSSLGLADGPDLLTGGQGPPGAPGMSGADLPLAFLVAHETAHKWIGGIAGTRLVGSAWLSEGLAEYLGFLALEEIAGREISTAYLLERVLRPYAERAQARQRPLAGIELFDGDYELLYQKGALVFRMLHRRLGDEGFFGLIRSFIEAHRGRFATGEDFIEFASAYAAGLAGEAGGGLRGGTHGAGGAQPREIRSFFEQWVKGTHTLDYALRVLEAGGRRLVVQAVPVGRLVEPGEVSLAVRLEDGSRVVERIALNETVTLEFASRPVFAHLDPEAWLADANPANNIWQAP